MSHFPFLNLPMELRIKVYRYILVSELEYSHHPNLWRPVAADGNVFRIGYFKRDTVLPLLLVNHQINSEAIPVLYGENTFFLQFSGFSDLPLSFFSRLPSEYLPLLRKVFVRTGFHIRRPIDRYLRTTSGPNHVSVYTSQKPEVKALLRYKDIANSAKLIKQAWPSHLKLCVNRESVIYYDGKHEFEEDLFGSDGDHEWVFSSWHLWKLIIPVSASAEPEFEFRRVVWDNHGLPSLPPR